MEGEGKEWKVEGKRGKEREGVMKWYPTFCDKVTPLGDVITTCTVLL